MGWDVMQEKGVCVCCFVLCWEKRLEAKPGEEEQLVQGAETSHMYSEVDTMSRYDLFGSCSLYNRG